MRLLNWHMHHSGLANVTRRVSEGLPTRVCKRCLIFAYTRDQSLAYASGYYPQLAKLSEETT